MKPEVYYFDSKLEREKISDFKLRSAKVGKHVCGMRIRLFKHFLTSDKISHTPQNFFHIVFRYVHDKYIHF